ncbi:hypothetical protein [Methylibium sp.]|uniref:hypothetical protein n=1 Tax=Methylibium sp. TaxID=2067992 RepID=UPI003D0FE987
MTSKGSSIAIGAATEAVLQSVVSAGASTVSVADAGTREAFIDAWVRTLSEHARHLRKKGEALGAPCVLVYVPDVAAFGEQHGTWTSRTTLGDSHLDDFAGMLAVGNTEVGGRVHPQKFPAMAGIETAMRDSGLAGAAAVGLMSESKMIVWVDGIDGDDKHYEREILNVPTVIDLSAIESELERFYQLFACHTKKWWLQPARHVTVDNPERAVQDDLWLYLLARLADVATVRTEESIGRGRADITIFPKQTVGGNQSAVLELKTIRDVHTPKDKANKDVKLTKFSESDKRSWALEGLQQTATYRDDREMDGAYLCLYDFCSVKSQPVYDAVDPYAANFGVRHLPYHIPATHAEYREAKYPLEND